MSACSLSFIRVVLGIHGKQVETILVTGSTFTLRQLWEGLAKPGEQMKEHFNRTFLLADGKVQTSEGRVPITYEWHGMVWTVDTYGLDFLSQK